MRSPSHVGGGRGWESENSMSEANTFYRAVSSLFVSTLPVFPLPFYLLISAFRFVHIYPLTLTSMLPVSVLISHLPPVMVFGTLTCPVSDSAKKILSVRSSPLMLPVSVSM